MTEGQNDRVKAFLKTQRITQETISGEIGMQRSTVGFNLNKKPMDPEFLESLRNMLEISLKDWQTILEGEPDPRDKEIAYLKRINELQEHEIERLEDDNKGLKTKIADLERRLNTKLS